MEDRICTGTKPKKTCIDDNCDRPVLARGLCPTHYSYWHRSQRVYTIVCLACGQKAQVPRNYQTHCSYKCGMDSVNAAKAGMTVQEWLSRPDFMRGRRKWTRIQRKAQKAAQGTKGRGSWVSKTCKMCPSVFVVRASSTDRCCSETCTAKNKQEVRHRKVARRRARKLDAFIEDVDRMTVFERDKFVCYLCKRRTKLYPNKSWHPRKATVDHVIPLAAGRNAGGLHGYQNCRTACQECNSRKSDRGGGEQLALAV